MLYLNHLIRECLEKERKGGGGGEKEEDEEVYLKMMRGGQWHRANGRIRIKIAEEA